MAVKVQKFEAGNIEKLKMIPQTWKSLKSYYFCTALINSVTTKCIGDDEKRLTFELR